MSTVTEVIEGLTILNSYRNCRMDVGHDVIYAGPGNQEDITEEDKIKLQGLGWYWDNILDCWAKFI